MAVKLLQQIEVDNVPERVPPDAGNSVGVEQQELQRRQSLEDSGRQFRDSVPVQNPVETKDTQHIQTHDRNDDGRVGGKRPTYSDVSDLRPWKASPAIDVI